MSTTRGVFVTLEGGEGAGKSSLVAALAQALRAQGIEVIATREPGGTPGATAIRALLVQGEQDRWSSLCELLLLAAARCDHVERVIRPALARGALVLCDRFTDSTRAYQVAGRGACASTEADLRAMIQAPRPDLTILLDIDPALGVARSQGARAGEARYEGMDLAFHQRVRQGFLDIAEAEPERVVRLDASQDRDEILAAALALVRERFSTLGT